MKKNNVKRIITSDSNKFFEIAISSSELKSITGGISEIKDIDSCGCHGCANLCCSGFNPSCSNLA